ncbi:hypothetical protein AAE478_004624 [Parahypoxylon ruwenzoriense]
MLTVRLLAPIRSSAGAAKSGRLAFPRESTTNPHSLRTPAHTISRTNFSTRSRLSIKQPTNENSSKPPANPSLGEFSFEGLGMSRNVKIFIIAILSIFGTIETYFWVMWIRRWFAGGKDDESSESET